MHPPAKFQPHIPITFEVTALQSRKKTERLICTASLGEINYMLLTKMVVTYDQNYTRSTILFAISRRIDYWVRFFLYHLSSPYTKVKLVNKDHYHFDIM